MTSMCAPLNSPTLGADHSGVRSGVCPGSGNSLTAPPVQMDAREKGNSLATLTATENAAVGLPGRAPAGSGLDRELRLNFHMQQPYRSAGTGWRSICLPTGF